MVNLYLRDNNGCELNIITVDIGDNEHQVKISIIRYHRYIRFISVRYNLYPL